MKGFIWYLCDDWEFSVGRVHCYRCVDYFDRGKERWGAAKSVVTWMYKSVYVVYSRSIHCCDLVHLFRSMTFSWNLTMCRRLFPNKEDGVGFESHVQTDLYIPCNLWRQSFVEYLLGYRYGKSTCSCIVCSLVKSRWCLRLRLWCLWTRDMFVRKFFGCNFNSFGTYISRTFYTYEYDMMIIL